MIDDIWKDEFMHHRISMESEYREIRKKCSVCDGNGWYATGEADNAVQLQCEFCLGTGFRLEESK